MISFPASLRKAAEKDDVTFDSAVRYVESKTADDEPVYGYDRVVQTRGSGRSSGASGAPLPTGASSIVKGVWVDEDTFHPLPEGALDKIAEDTQISGIEIEEFVALKDVPFARIEAAYYLAPQKGLIGAKPMKLLAKALKAQKAAGLCKLTLKGSTGRQRLGAVHEMDGKLVVNTLAFAADWRATDEAANALENVEIDPKLVRMARDLVAKGTVSGEESRLLNHAVDDAVAARSKLYEDALEGNPVVKTKPRKVQPAEASDLMAALEASLETQGAKVPA